MTSSEDDRQTKEWEQLYRRVRAYLSRKGTENGFGEADFSILSDNYGFRSINVAVNRLSFLKPEILKPLQKLLADFPAWEIKVALDVPGKEDLWPAMEIIIRPGSIVDGLQRSYLPAEFQTFRF